MTDFGVLQPLRGATANGRVSPFRSSAPAAGAGSTWPNCDVPASCYWRRMASGTSPGERVLLELEPVARAAAQEAVDAERAELSDWQQKHVVFGANLGERWAVFDWYVPGAKQKDAYVFVRACVDRNTKEVIVERRPEPASRPKRTLTLSVYAVVAPVVIAVCFLLLFALVNYFTGKGWPPIDGLIHAAPTFWVSSQLMVLAILYRIVASIPIRLPDRTFLSINRVWLKKGRTNERA